jgi:putative oxidoreductase
LRSCPEFGSPSSLLERERGLLKISTSPSTEEPVQNHRFATELWVPRALALLRIVTGYLFLLHGSAKLLGFPHAAGSSTVPVMSLIGVAGLLELIGGALIVLGLFVRPVAFVLSGEMAIAYFTAHASAATVLFPLLNRGDAAVLYCFVFLFLAAAGGGAWSVDAMRRARAGPTLTTPAA